MPKVNLREEFDMTTRDKYTKVGCAIGMTVDGKELPNMAVLGNALEEAIKLIQERITESYKVVPPRNEFEDIKPGSLTGINKPAQPTQVNEPVVPPQPAQPAQPTQPQQPVNEPTPTLRPVPFGN